MEMQSFYKKYQPSLGSKQAQSQGITQSFDNIILEWMTR
jgi:hypothetical protein